MADHVVLSVLAHPDDAEFLCAGVLIRLAREHGWRVHIATMTPRDCGSAEQSAEEISRIRPREGARAAAVIETKAEMLACHASQRNWLLKHHGMDQYLQTMRDWSGRRGRPHGVAFAEGFRQHLGHSYPQDNMLGQVLGVLA